MMTPMVDVVLVLLVIMMVSAIYIVSQALKVELPKTASSDGVAQTPLVVTIQRDGNYLFNQKPIDETTPEALGVDIAPRLKVVSVAEPKTREAGIKIDSAAVLVEKLKNEAGVL